MLIIFDCDGVLVDSERLAADIFSQALDGIKIFMSPAECFDTFKGRTLTDCYNWLEIYKTTALPENFHADLERLTQRRFSDELQPVPGVSRVLQELDSKGVALCVASNGGHEKIKNSLHVTGLLSYFPHRFSAEDVPVGKPSPDLFLYAAERMGESIASTIVVEDSWAGWKAAQAAGMETIVYAPEGDVDFSPKILCSTMVEVASQLKKFLGKDKQ